MSRSTPLRKIALVCDYPPRQCGIATFSHDVYRALTSQFPDIDCRVVAVNDPLPEGESYDYPPEVRFEIEEQDQDSYRRAADFINFGNTEVVYIQHEFGIYGGPSGSHILTLLRHVKAPVVVHLHTILEEPGADQLRVMREMERRVARFVVMSERGANMLRDIYKIAPARIDIIPHGIPDMPFADPASYKDQFGVEGKKTLLTFGLLSPGKGIEYVIRALPEVVRHVPDLVYIVLGATHPNLVRDQGESYRLGLERLAAELGVQKHVAFYNRFVELDELKEFLGATDIYVTPYLNPAQITSGTLAYAFGCGRAVVSTPYWHAEELLANGRGVLVPFRDSAAIARELSTLLTDDARLQTMRKQAYQLGREMTWPQVAHRFLGSFRQARAAHVARSAARFTLHTLEEQRHELPELRIEHLRRLSDSTGIFQHAVHALPNFHEGYCVDDNARALLLTAAFVEATGDATNETRRLASSYAAFLNHAFVPATGRFHNFMSFDRSWLDDTGSDDSLGRSLWALGACVGRSRDRLLQRWAAQLFERALPAIEATTSARAWAFALIGIHEYLRRFGGDTRANAIRQLLTGRIVALHHDTATDDWPWFEPSLTYDNAKLSHALILAGRWMPHPEALETGLLTLRWLTTVQTAPAGHFRPVGSDGFYPKGGTCARFDQQPIEAQTTVSACLEAYGATNDNFWLTEAYRAFEWFLGRNDLGEPLYDPATGGCCDALHSDRVNLNQGAESTLAFLLSLQEMRLVKRSLESFERPIEPGQPDL
ncbi:glycosyltransferase family 4 protein [Geminisphaera colitermitum]|uniref:glycosyltransferase family 4 protein n=1 Tax=Geminisphaera colitermitum TaxID=1148786 RepID=UPI0001965536|nr:glycosyltransferase family 4 protein [Geminisphaera colitermitum]